MFFSPPFSCSASLCEQLLAGGSGETPAYSFVGKTAVLLLPSTMYFSSEADVRLEDCRITTSFYCEIGVTTVFSIGRLPYYYFLLLSMRLLRAVGDWKTAVLLLPSTSTDPVQYDWKTAVLLLPSTELVTPRPKRLEDCRIITSFYSEGNLFRGELIGRLPYYYFLLL